MLSEHIGYDLRPVLSQRLVANVAYLQAVRFGFIEHFEYVFISFK